MSNELIEQNNSSVVIPADNSPVNVMLAAIKQGATLEQVEKMMDLQDRWDKAQAKKAYDTAFAAFKAEAVTIIKGKTVTDGPLKGKSYDELHDVVNAVTPALSKHGLSSWWRLTKDEPTWMEVTCYLRHVSGHEESVSMGGPPDAGGAKNPIQARASTKTYLERYTLKGITGLSSQNDDNDGAGGQQQQHTSGRTYPSQAAADAMTAAQKESPTQLIVDLERIAKTKGDQPLQEAWRQLSDSDRSAVGMAEIKRIRAIAKAIAQQKPLPPIDEEFMAEFGDEPAHEEIPE